MPASLGPDPFCLRLLRPFRFGLAGRGTASRRSAEAPRFGCPALPLPLLLCGRLV